LEGILRGFCGAFEGRIFVSIWRGFHETPSSLGDMGVSKSPTLLRNPTISWGNTPYSTGK
jgi:hypothetical protein